MMVLFLLSLPKAMDVNDCGVHVSHVDYLVQQRNKLLVVAVGRVACLNRNNFKNIKKTLDRFLRKTLDINRND